MRTPRQLKETLDQVQGVEVGGTEPIQRGLGSSPGRRKLESRASELGVQGVGSGVHVVGSGVQGVGGGVERP